MPFPYPTTVPLTALPFRIGRSADSELVLAQPYVSRLHAEILKQDDSLVLFDRASRQGTYVNGKRVLSHVLQPGDSLQFGSLDGLALQFGSGGESEPHRSTTTHGLLSNLHAINADGTDLEKLRWFLQAARDLNSAGAIDRIMISLLETTLALARVERGFVFLCNGKHELQLACGMDANGHVLHDGSTVSRTVIRQAIEGQEQFLITDTLTAEEQQLPESIVAHNIRAVICVPLRQRRGSALNRSEGSSEPAVRPLLGVLYLDSHFAPARVSDVDHELMRTIAREAAALVENAQLAAVEEQARQHDEELQLAASIQQGLMQVDIPELDFAEVQAYSLPCKAVGGDFFDVLLHDDVLSVALVDVSGKGVSAAILASTLQGMLSVQLQTAGTLGEIAVATNAYLCRKNIGKYATMLLLRLHGNGRLEYLNCGHVQPRLCSSGQLSKLTVGNPPVGLLPGIPYESGEEMMPRGSHVVLVSDGFTEAEDANGDFFGEHRMENACGCGDIEAMLKQMREFCRDHPPNDDCTVLQVRFLG